MNETRPSTVLVVGYGNPAREDDGLGPAVADAIEKLALEGVTVDADYQLTVEDAAAAAEHDSVVFVDASVEGDGTFTFTRLEPKRQESFSSHSVAPEAVAALAEDLFGHAPAVYMLGIRGYSFAMFTETMTDKAQHNLDEALAFLVPLLRSKEFERAAGR